MESNLLCQYPAQSNKRQLSLRFVAAAAYTDSGLDRLESADATVVNLPERGHRLENV